MVIPSIDSGRARLAVRTSDTGHVPTVKHATHVPPQHLVRRSRAFRRTSAFLNDCRNYRCIAMHSSRSSNRYIYPSIRSFPFLTFLYASTSTYRVLRVTSIAQLKSRTARQNVTGGKFKKKLSSFKTHLKPLACTRTYMLLNKAHKYLGVNGTNLTLVYQH